MKEAASMHSVFTKVVLFTDTDGRASWREEVIGLDEGSPQARLSALLPSGGIQLRESPVGFRSEFHGLRFGHLAAVVSVVVIVLSMVPMGMLTNVAVEMMVVILGLYVIQGMAILHAVVAIRKMHIAWLAGVYIVTLFVLPQLMVVVALLGLIDTWVDVRQRAGTA